MTRTTRHLFLIPGFFGFANLGDFTYWGRVRAALVALLDEAGMPAEIHCVTSLPTASLRQRSRSVLEAIAAVDPGPDAHVHLVGHSTGGLDARLLLTPAVDLDTAIDPEPYVARVRSCVGIATPNRGAPIASFFASLLGGQLLRALSLMTMASLRVGHLPLSAWTKIAGMFALPDSLQRATGTLVGQLYEQLLADFDEGRRDEVLALLGEVERDQSLLMQLTVETMDVFNAAAGDRDGVLYGSVVTRARPPTFEAVLDIGLDPIAQAEHAFYRSLSALASGYDFAAPNAEHGEALRAAFGEVPDAEANDGIVPTLSQPWGRCIAAVQADHLDIIGHHGSDPGDPAGERHYDWITTRSNFRRAQFYDVWR